jgi:hypothetical protein
MLMQGKRLTWALGREGMGFWPTPPVRNLLGLGTERGLGVIPYLFTCSPRFDMVNATSEQRQRQRTSRA